LIQQVWVALLLRDDALKVLLAGNPDQALSIAFDMIAVAVKDTLAVLRGRMERSAADASLPSRVNSGNLARRRTEGKGHKSGLATSKEQVSKLGLALGIQTHNFTIKYGGADL
jgi:hypothetical protein